MVWADRTRTATSESDVIDRHIDTVQVDAGDRRVTQCRRQPCGASEPFLFLGIGPHINKADKSQDPF